jgi:glucose-1-phosphate adenylyltransferase
MQKECIAMLLAGGEGSRLGVLTKERAKPAVPFGGKYRIIDFTLSNCVNSRIDTVGILTQYQPLELNDYIGNGQPWDLDRLEGGVHILPPYQKRQNSDWYKGTANAIMQNIPFIKQYNPSYVLILSGDHIYKMDYSKMLTFHKEKNADCTIAVINVSEKDASRFGIMNTNDDNSIYEFEEKPKDPKSTKASMGVYIFNWSILMQFLEQDDQDDTSSNDFGKNIIPAMLNANQRLYAYPFDGYWKDVGTIESLWESNMDLITLKDNIISTKTEWQIYARSPIMPPHYISSEANVTNSIISGGCNIYGQVDTSVIFHGVTIEPEAIIKNSVIMPGSHIKKGASIYHAIIDETVIVGEKSVIGIPTDDNKKDDNTTTNATTNGILVIGKGSNIRPGVVITDNSMIENEITEVIT